MAPATEPIYISNQEFARAVGISVSMASRLRSGVRLPSADLIDRISGYFNLPVQEVYDARRKGPQAFGRWLREAVIGEHPESTKG